VAFLFVKTHDFDVKRSTKVRIERRASLANDDVMSSVGSAPAHTYWQLMKELLQIKIWVFITLIISILYFIVTGI